MSSTFNPNSQPGYEWGTYTPLRTPAWKVHRRRSDATNAFNRYKEITLYRSENGQWVEKQSKAPAPAPAPKPAAKPAPPMNFRSDRQRELMRVLLDQFGKFQQRGQAYYDLEGMSTSHLTLKAIGDLKTLHAFWPSEHVSYDHVHGNIYRLGDDTLTKVQSGIRQEVERLETQGYVQRLGNEHERRWRPAKHLKGVTL